VIVDCAIYQDGVRRDGKVELAHAYDERHERGKFVWIGLYEPTEDEFDSLTREFGLHPLAVEDAIHAHQRPKLEIYDEMVFLVLKTARYVDPTEVIELGELLVFLGDDYVITVRHGEGSALKRVRDSLDADPEHLRRGPGAVLHWSSTTTNLRSRAWRPTSTRWRRISSRAGGRIPRSASTGFRARS
jgi:magnesium transporter